MPGPADPWGPLGPTLHRSRPCRRPRPRLRLLALLTLAGAALAAGPQAAALGHPAHTSPPAAGDYRFEGTGTSGAPRPGQAPLLAPGTYTDTIDPGQTRWYAVRLDAVSTADLSVTAAPRPGAAADFGDGLELKLITTGTYGYTCANRSAHFQQDEGAMNLTGAVSRIPSEKHEGDCDRAGRYLLAVHRTAAAGSDPARWPVELVYGTEPPLPAGTVPAAARTDYGPPPAPVTGAPKDITGGTGFNDATRLDTGVWRDRIGPGRIRYYKVRLGWGQQLTYSAEFANDPALADTASGADPTFVGTTLYAPGRLLVHDASDGRDNRLYDGSPVSVGLGTVPVTWTNRWVDDSAAHEVRQAGDYWIAVGLGPGTPHLPADTEVGFVLRVRVSGQELAGPQYRAPAVGGRAGAAGKGAAGGSTGTPAAVGSSAGAKAADAGASASGPVGAEVRGVTGKDWIAAGGGGAVALAGLAVAALVRRIRTRTDRGGI